MATVMINQFIAKFDTNEDGVLTDIPKEELEEIIKKVMAMGLEKKPRKVKKLKDPNAPKKALSGYFIFLAEKREEIASGLEDLNGRERVIQTTKTAGEMWGKLSDEEKEPYKQKSLEDKERYLEEMKTYEPSDEESTEVAFPEAPEGWDGPFRMTYLYKVAKGEDGKNIKSVKSFEEAVTMAETLGSGCGGITKTSRGYSLRVGPELKENPEKYASTGLASWVKKSSEEPEADEVEEPKADEVEEPKADEVEEPEADEVEEPEADEVEEPKAKKTVKKTKKSKKVKEPKKTKKVKEPKKTEEPKKKGRGRTKKVKEPEDPSDEVEETEDAVEMKVTTIEYDGESYYHDEATGKIYDPETSEEIGKMVEGEIEFDEE